MRSYLFLIITAMTALVCTVDVSDAEAQGLVIGNGSTLTINGGTLDVNCQHINVNDGGSLLLNTGILQDKGKIFIEPAGVFTNSSGTLYSCSNSFYILHPPNQSPIIISLPKN